jgi:hypothetical protein
MTLPNNRLKVKDLRFKKISFLVLFLLLTSCFLLLARTNAQEAVRTITVTPPTVSVTGNPGYYTEGTMGVINDSDSAITFKAEMHDFIVQDTAGTPEILPANTLMTTYSAAAWMGVTPQTFTIQPKKRQNLNYFIQIPGNAKPGGHYAAVVFVPVNEKVAVGNTGSQVNGQIGTLFSVAVSGPIKENASITKFFANTFQEYGPVNILSQIKNHGDLHIKPKGYVTVSDMLGRKAILPLKEFNIFPQAARDYENQFGTGFMIGRFKAELLASYGVSNNLPLTATVYFWIFPWKIVTITILIIIALILGFKYYKKNGLKKPGKKVEIKTESTSETPEAK